MVEALFALVFGTLTIGAVALVSAPLRRSQQAKPASDDGQQRDLLPAREAALRGLRELDFDYRLGNLAETDYHDLRERQKLEAIALLRATNEAPIDDPLQAEIERRVREARQRRGARLVRSGQDGPASAIKVSRATRWPPIERPGCPWPRGELSSRSANWRAATLQATCSALTALCSAIRISSRSHGGSCTTPPTSTCTSASFRSPPAA